MKKMFAAERRGKIIDILHKKKRATVKELSAILNVSEATLRTDLNLLENQGLVERTHGGAMLKQELTSPEYNFSFREKKNRNEKKAIGYAASQLVEDSQCIFLDASSTVLEMARVLKEKNIRLTVITNGLYAAMELKENPEITVILLGGVLRVGSIAVEGTLGVEMLDKLHIDTMFTSSSGLSLEEGLTDFNVYEVDLKKEVVSKTDTIVALVDYTKIGRKSIAQFAPIDRVQTVITNEQASQEALEELKKRKINVVIAEHQAAIKK